MKTEQNEIKIYVVGNTNVGKSTICELIHLKLKEIGFNDVNIVNIDGDEENVRRSLLKRIDAIKERDVKLTIVEQQAQRTPVFIPNVVTKE